MAGLTAAAAHLIVREAHLPYYSASAFFLQGNISFLISLFSTSLGMDVLIWELKLKEEMNSKKRTDILLSLWEKVI